MAAVLTGCTHHDTATPDTKATDVAAPYPVALHVRDVPSDLTVGLVFSLASPPGEGAEWRDAAQGAAVAAWRLKQGGTPVTVTAVDDKGTADGARAAVQTLADGHVAAIVFATSGAHLDDAVTAAAGAGIPALLPYGWQQETVPDGAWITGPDAGAVRAAIAKVLSRLGATHPGAVVAGRTPVVDVSDAISLRDGTSAAELSATLKDRLSESRADALLVSADAAQQAAVAAAFQATGLSVPLVFTPDALSPVFPAGLSKADASLSGDYWSVGAAVPDSTALTGTEAGRASAAFLAAVRQAAADPNATTLLGDEPFATVAADADAASHDAVLAVVLAAAKVESADPAEISTALRSLTLGHAEGLAGPGLNFTVPHALAAEHVGVLRAARQESGLRPVVNGAGALVWFTAQDK